jgi:hypothetical protein
MNEQNVWTHQKITCISKQKFKQLFEGKNYYSVRKGVNFFDYCLLQDL